jgi:hypothetical protein
LSSFSAYPRSRKKDLPSQPVTREEAFGTSNGDEIRSAASESSIALQVVVEALQGIVGDLSDSNEVLVAPIC